MYNKLLGRRQQVLIEAINTLAEHQRQQKRVLTSFYGHTQRHLRIMTLMDLLSDSLDHMAYVAQKALSARVACEAGHVNELLLPPRVAEEVRSSGQSHQVLSLVAYYGYFEVEKITILDGDVYCVIKAHEILKYVHIHTFPVCTNGTRCAVLYQPPPFVINSPRLVCRE